MSFTNFQQAIELATKCNYYTIIQGGKSSEDIIKAEKLLDIKFSKQNVEFYRKLGYLSFYGTEIFGIEPDDNSEILEGNSVAYALNDRKEYGLPQEWLPIYNYNDGNMAYLNYGILNEDGEPEVIIAIYTGNGYEIAEKVANDFGDFLLQLVQQQLDSQ